MEITADDYARAEKLLSLKANKLVLNTIVEPNWLGQSDRFWYRKETKPGKRFLLVDASGKTVEAFDHERLAKLFSSANRGKFSGANLPFDRFDYVENGKSIMFHSKEKQWICNLDSYRHRLAAGTESASSDELLSPDHHWAAKVKKHNISVRSLLTNEEFTLTTDGRPSFDYGTSPEGNCSTVSDRLGGIKHLPVAIWSADSKKLIVHKLDQRRVGKLHLVQSSRLPKGNARPILWSYRYPLPHDRHMPTAHFIILDVENKSVVEAKCNPVTVPYVTPIEAKLIWWGRDSRRLYLIRKQRGEEVIQLEEIDANSGATRIMLVERGKTQVEPKLFNEPFFAFECIPNVYVLQDTSEVIWFSERDGWGHLYLYDGRTGLLKKQLTSGEWVVRDLLFVDEPSRTIYFTAGGREKGRDPYYRHLYRMNLDRHGIHLLTPEDADHDVRFSPTGRFFVDNYSRVETTPRTLLRRNDGKLIRVVEKADIEGLKSTGWIPPKRFKVKGRDGKTDIYGVIYFPSKFDSSKKYPVIDDLYPGPQFIRSVKSFDPDPNSRIWYWHAQAIAELGFVVVTMDGMGTALRSKEFHDVSFRVHGEACGLEDHVVGLPQLAKSFPCLDLERVGAYGHSGGGFATARAMFAYPEFYKVGVSSSGDHDHRGYVAMNPEKYHYADEGNASLAHRLKGKLLLAHGDMDDNVHPSLTIQVVSALVEANKDFDFLLLPNRNHGIWRDPYFIRRRWDFFVEHLMGAKPPKDYVIASSLD